MVDLIERIDVLLRQEDTVYATVDYLESGYQLMLEGSSTPPPVLGSSFSVGPSTNSSSKDIDEFWREKIVEWMYQVIDHFDFSREIVSIAVSYLDRFLATRHVTKQLFQLISITTLYLAIKLYEGKRIHMYTMTRLSRGFFTVEDLQLMELEVLR
mgnify:CR=1 FL=1